VKIGGSNAAIDISVVVGSLCVKPLTLFLPKAVANIKKSSPLYIHPYFDSAYLVKK
jgi:hypothetical protein